MKKTISFMLIALMLSVGFVNTYAAQTHHGQQVAASTSKTISGQIARIKNNSLTIKDSAGKYHMVSVTDPSMLNGLKSGDNISYSTRTER